MNRSNHDTSYRHSPSHGQLRVETQDGTTEIALSAAESTQSLTDVLRRHGFPLNTRCGGRNLCHGCSVELTAGELTNSDGEVLHAGSAQALRACQVHVQSGATIRVPGRSMLGHQPQVVTNFRLNVPRAHDPLWQVVAVPLRELCCDNDVSTHIISYVARQLSVKSVHCDGGIKLLPVSDTIFLTCEFLPDGWHITNCSDVKPNANSAIAIDIGTTTVAVLLVDLKTGEVLAQAGAFNKQMHSGDDVLTRINLCMNDKTEIEKLQSAVVETIESLVNETLHTANKSRDDIACYVAAGNSTMQHLIAGVDPTSMGFAPFTPQFLEHRAFVGKTIGLSSTHKVHLLPGAAAYVGADLCAGILSSGLIYDDGPSLLVDVGTNGEIIFKHGEKLWGCATAAGPAFEGAGLSNGMRAGDGAISRIAFDENFNILTEHIHPEKQLKPLGICGSAYLDFLAQARNIELLNMAGRFDRSSDAGEVLQEKGLLVQGEWGWQLEIARGAGRQSIFISEPDIARLLQAKAAIAAGILTLLARCDVRPQDVKKLYLAGGFGLHIKVENAITCGLLPEFSPEQIEVVGNTSLAGAYLALLDSHTVEEMERVRQDIEIIELNLDPEFETTYIDQLMLGD